MPSKISLLPLDQYGNVDVRARTPAGLVFLPNTEAEKRCLRAGIPTAKALIGFKQLGRGRFKPTFASGTLAAATWAEELYNWEASEARIAARKAINAEEQKEVDERRGRRKERAQKAAEARRLRTDLSKNDYGQMLLHLLAAQDACDRSANDISNRRFRIYLENDLSLYAKPNSRRSRSARAKDYIEKVSAIERAGELALKIGINFGWKKHRDRNTWIVCFDTRTGQVSFQTVRRSPGPEYTGEWDGNVNIARKRIEAAIQIALATG